MQLPQQTYRVAKGHSESLVRKPKDACSVFLLASGIGGFGSNGTVGAQP
jgi:hypothetical protein